MSITHSVSGQVPLVEISGQVTRDALTAECAYAVYRGTDCPLPLGAPELDYLTTASVIFLQEVGNLYKSRWLVSGDI